MSLRSLVPTVSILPHLFSKLEPEDKLAVLRKYKKVKRYGSLSSITLIAANEGLELSRDVIKSKLKAHGYKSLFAISLGPLLQVISLPMYVVSYGLKVRKFAVASSELGAQILKGQLGIVNWAWIGADLLLFGEPVSITDNSTCSILQNETATLLDSLDDLTN